MIKIWLIYGDQLHKLNYRGGIFRKIMVGTLQAQTWNDDFVRTSFTSSMDFIVWYSVTNTSLSCNSKFSFQGNSYMRKYLECFYIHFLHSSAMYILRFDIS
jgi:hypothetical protein